MKKLTLFWMITVIGLVSLTACVNKKEMDFFTIDDILEAYEDTAYEIKTWDYTSEAYPYEYDYYVTISKDNKEEAFYYIFSSAEDAEEYKNNAQWNVVLWFYSAVSGDPIWVHCKQYGNVVVQYEESSFIKPFKTYEK